MKQELIQQFMLKNGEFFDPLVIPSIQKKLEEIDDSNAAIVLGVSLMHPTLILVIAIVLGWERFFLNDIPMGILKIITCYGFGIWWLVDLFTASKRARDYNYNKFVQATMFCR